MEVLLDIAREKGRWVYKHLSTNGVDQEPVDDMLKGADLGLSDARTHEVSQSEPFPDWTGREGTSHLRPLLAHR